MTSTAAGKKVHQSVKFGVQFTKYKLQNVQFQSNVAGSTRLNDNCGRLGTI